MNNWERLRRQRLDAALRMYELPAPEPPGGTGVVAEWPDPAEASFLGAQDWRTLSENTWPGSGGAVREWVLARGQERLSVRLFVSSSGDEPARAYFLRAAYSPTAAEIPYERELLGEALTLFLAAPASDQLLRGDNLLRLYRNIAFEVRAYAAAVNVRDVAAFLQDIAKEHADVPLSEHQPRLAPPHLFPEELQTGRRVRIKIPGKPNPEASPEEAPFAVTVETEGAAVDFVGFRNELARFRLAEPGLGRIRVQAVDRRTLLSKGIELDLQVR